MAEPTKAVPLASTLLAGEVIGEVISDVVSVLYSSSVRGSLCVTNYRMMFTPSDLSLSSLIRPRSSHINRMRPPTAAPQSNKFNRPYAVAPTSIAIRPSAAAFDLPLAVIDTIGFNDSVLTITCKDMRIIRLNMGSSRLKESPRLIKMLILRVLPPISVTAQFAFDYSTALKHANVSKGEATNTNGWLVYSPIADYVRLGFIGSNTENNRFRLLKNSSYRFSPTYPLLMIVPAAVTEDELVSVARMRVHARIPVAIWRHSVNNSVLVRSSDPIYGFFRKRCAPDEQLLRCYRDAANVARDHKLPLYIMYAHATSLVRSGSRIGGKGSNAL